MLPLPPPEPLALLQAAAEDSVTAGLASLPQDLRSNSTRHVVMLRGRRRVFLLDNGRLCNAFPVAIGMPGWETPTGRFEVLQKIPNPVWVHPVSADDHRKGVAQPAVVEQKHNPTAAQRHHLATDIAPQSLRQ